MSGWYIVRSYIRRNWPAYAGGVALTGTSSILAALIPRLLGQFADQVNHGALRIRETSEVAVLIIIIGISRVTLMWTGRMTVRRKGRILSYNLRRDLLRKWMTHSPSYYHSHSTGDLLSHALSDVEVVQELMSMAINVSATGLSMMAAVLYMMAVHGDSRLTLCALAPLLVIPLLVRLMGPKIRKQSQYTQEALGRLSQTVEEFIGGIRAVKAFGNEGVVIARYGCKVESIVEEKMRFVRLSALFGSLVPLMSNLGFIIVLGYGGFLAIEKVITLGDFVAFTMYVTMLRNPLEHLGQVINAIQRASASLARLANLMLVSPAVSDSETALLDRPFRGELTVKGLTFRYPGTERDVLTDISFTTGPGKSIGIVGPIGSGKSTLANLLLRMYDPPEGTVYLDGEDILRYPLERLRLGTAYVPQDGFLFSATVLENICFSAEEPDRRRAEQAARVGAVYDNILGFPDGFDTEIGERGVRLSGGEKQRLTIARMIYKDAAILILDDSLSAVDTKTERSILENMRNLPELQWGGSSRDNTTNIIISHRLSSVRHADEILVLEGGKIAERGNHAALLSLRGSYARLWGLQSGLTDEETRSRFRDSDTKTVTDVVEEEFVREFNALEPCAVEESG